VADDLPRQQLLAAVYTGMQPAAHLWMKYVEEIERLESRGEVNPDEAVILRSRPEARDVLMDVTLGETSKINPESMEIIVDRVRENLSSPYRVDAHRASVERDRAEEKASTARSVSDGLLRDVGDLQAKLGHLEAQDQVRDKRIQERATRRAHRIVLAAVTAVVLVFIIPTTLKIADPAAVKHLPAGIAVTFTAVAVILVALKSTQTLVGGTIMDWFGPVERRLAARIERRLRVSAGLLPSQLDE
jgi:hypothetical protein